MWFNNRYSYTYFSRYSNIILTYIPDGILQVVLILLYILILAALITTIVSRADRER